MEVEKAFKRLLIKSPFYGLFCLSLPKRTTTSVETLCVVKKGLTCELLINPDFWKQHTDDEQIALLQHEVSHICFQHMLMSDSFAEQRMFNAAADMEVNSYIEHLPEDACTASRIGLQDGLGTKQYYEALTKKQQQQQAQNPQQPCNGGQGGQGNQDSPQGDDEEDNKDQGNNDSSQGDNKKQDKQDSNNTNDGSNGGENKKEEDKPQKKSQYPDFVPDEVKPIDDHDSWKSFRDAPAAVKQLIQNNINSVLKNTAEQIAKSRGTIPSEFTELIEKLNKKKPEIFNWKAYFRRLLGSIYDVNVKSTRRKESKRFEGNAGIQHKKKVSILVAIDTSGSVSNKELQDFFSEIEYIYKAGARITLLECDARINKVVEYDGRHIPEVVGRGGTNFNPPVEYYIKHKKEYASLIYFTDGECSLPYKRPSGMVWVITSGGWHQEYPGKTIYIPKENDNC